MKIAATVARYLLGLIFLVFGADKFYPFIHSGPLPAGAAGQFMGLLMSTKYMLFVGSFEVSGGLLLLINRFVPLALCLLAPVIVNILLVGILMTRLALPPGIVLAVLWILVFFRLRSAFQPLFQARVQE
ncbi:MAG TPA: DoxX family membrane protein [Terracidiphilus sp.]|nr:DoxX family membrane protein [Terracidiphilus sp.]